MAFVLSLEYCSSEPSGLLRLQIALVGLGPIHLLTQGSVIVVVAEGHQAVCFLQTRARLDLTTRYLARRS